MPLKIGYKAPDFALPSTGGDTFNLYEDQKGAPCILYFYPKDFTPGCTKEACTFRDHFETFRELDVDVFGISSDTLETHKKFKKEYDLPFELLADPNRKVIKRYDAKIGMLGMTRRVTYFLDADHIIKAVYENMFGARQHIQNMIKEIKAEI